MKKALIAMSGGVDSSVAAFLTKTDGYECIGATMRLFDNEDVGIPSEKTCCSLADVDDARSVAFTLGIPYYVLNFTDKFEETVIDKFVYCYENGLTPNPCIDCNRYLKFEKLYQRAKEIGYDYVVTGHYARIVFDDESGKFLLKKAVDDTKDQSYVLYSLTQDQLAHTLFPLGGLKKTEVRKIAEQNGFVNAKKHDSQDICFVQNRTYAEFIEARTKKKYVEGNFIDVHGNVLGKHKGIIRYTVGQRKGLGLSFSEPMYVKDVNPADNTVTLAKETELYTDTVFVNDVNLISVDNIDKPMRVTAKVRYRGKESPATVIQTKADELKIVFDSPERAVTRGQALVLYDGDTVVGGGTIYKSLLNS